MTQGFSFKEPIDTKLARTKTAYLMEEGRANVVEMAKKGEQTPTSLVVPQLDVLSDDCLEKCQLCVYFNLVIVSSRHENGLRGVEINASDRTCLAIRTRKLQVDLQTTNHHVHQTCQSTCPCGSHAAE